jgi:hypothetical protein
MKEHKQACCTSPTAVCYWFTVSLVAWGVLSLIGIFWRPLHGVVARHDPFRHGNRLRC